MAIYNHGLPIPRKRVEVGGGGVDTSQDTVIPEVLVKDYTAHDKDGNPIVGVLDPDAIKAEGYTEGHATGYTEGEAEGYEAGQTAGYNSGYAEGKADGVETGKQAEYDAFWDAYQNNGNRVSYNFAFAGQGWNEKTYTPKYPNMVTTYAMQMFMQSNIKEIGQIDVRGQYKRTSMFSTCYYLKKLSLIVDANTGFATWFTNCNALEDLTVDGVIGNNGFDVRWCPLNKASLTSIVNALSPTTTGLTVTLSLAAVNTAFETSAGAADGSTSDEWLALAATKSNWTISLINS